MIINFERTVAYRCASSGEITFGTFSLFELSGNNGISVHCSCGLSHLRILPESKTSYLISVKCIICDEIHKFNLPLQSLAKKDCCQFMCPNVVVGLVFIGKEAAIQKAVVKNEEDINEIITECGLDHTGKNGVTMLKALDKIQDLLDSNHLHCDCGSNIIDIEVHENDLILECCLCGASLVLTAEKIRNSDFTHLEQLIIKPQKY